MEQRIYLKIEERKEESDIDMGHKDNCHFFVYRRWWKSTKFFILLTTLHNFLIPFPASFRKILENFVKLLPQLCPFRNFFSQGLKLYVVLSVYQRILIGHLLLDFIKYFLISDCNQDDVELPGSKLQPTKIQNRIL